jgi:phosphoribosylformimino-5-aminoimidazole carboxamide ribotide isomerase
VGLARSFADAGAHRIHLVDLDAARGTGDNREAVANVITAAGIAVQVAGGIRDGHLARGWLVAGAAAVVVGTLAIRDPDMFGAIARAQPGRVLAALDVRAGRPAVTGWSETERRRIHPLVRSWNRLPLAGIVLTAIDRDGTMGGPDLPMLAAVQDSSRHPIIYSGGVGSFDDLRGLQAAGAAGIIVGKALYEGRLDLRAALAL